MMKKNIFIYVAALLFGSCLKDQYIPLAETCYPPEVDAIITTRCAHAGCHNAESKSAAAGLDLSNYNVMFDGTISGAVTVPYRPDFSPLLYFSNTDSTEGIVAYPTMPYNEAPLTKEQYNTLKNWISNGAPDCQGKVMFSDNPQRRKVYIANQGCDVVTVFDIERKVIMRYIDVGLLSTGPTEKPHMIRVSPDGKYWIVVFLESNMMQIFSTETDEKLFDVQIGVDGHQWNTFIISNDSKHAYAADFALGRFVYVDITTGTVENAFYLPGNLHGVTISPDDSTLYIGVNNSSAVIKLPVSSPGDYETIDLNGNIPFAGILSPHDIVFSPDGSKYFVTCEQSTASQVRVFNATDDQLLAAINVGLKPVELAVAQQGLLFVTCMEDNFFAGVTGSVSVIDMNQLNEVKRIRVGWQPHGIAVDEAEKLVYVANRNILGTGPAPHHPASCSGKNGSLSVIGINSLEVESGIKAELSVDPYGVTIRN